MSKLSLTLHTLSITGLVAGLFLTSYYFLVQISTSIVFSYLTDEINFFIYVIVCTISA